MGQTDAQGPVVIVGGGQAGAWTAIALRERAPDRPIILVGEEPLPPYERPPLSKDVLASKKALESAYIRAPEYYEQNAIRLISGQRVSTIDRDAKQVSLQNGERLVYSRLVLATGCRALTLPSISADHDTVCVLRSASDMEEIRSRLRPGAKIVAIGAGFIGLEIAATAVEASCEVTVVEREEFALSRVMAREVAQSIISLHEKRGVRFYWSAGVAGIEKAAQGTTVILEDGTRLPADMVILGVGAVPNTEQAEAIGLDCANGILVDEYGRTSDPSIFAAGDVTNHYNPLLKRRLRLESWQNAQNQGIAVARNLAGEDFSYGEVPWFWTDQYDVNIQMIGAPDSWDQVIWRGSGVDEKFTAIYMAGSQIVAGHTMNNARDIRVLRDLIGRGVAVDPQAAGDTSVKLKTLMKVQATE